MEGLPEEVALHIFSFVDVRSSPLLCRVSSRWRMLADDTSLWSSRLAASFPNHLISTRPASLHPKEYYKFLKRWMWKIDRERISSQLEVFDHGYSAQYRAINTTYPNFRPAVCVGGELDNDSAEYWEVHVKHIAQSSTIGVGLCTATADLNRLLYDHHGGAYYSDGRTGHSEMLTSTFESFSAGDVIGVLVDSGSVHFYKNGAYLGAPYSNLPLTQLYPAIVMNCPGDSATFHPNAPFPSMQMPAPLRSLDEVYL